MGRPSRTRQQTSGKTVRESGMTDIRIDVAILNLDIFHPFIRARQ